MPNEKTAKFNLLKKANEVKDDKGNVIICTRQENSAIKWFVI